MSTDLTLTRGDSATFTLTISNLSASGLAGCSLYFVAKRDRSDTDANAVFTKSTSDGITVTTTGSDTVDGVASVVLDPADTSGLPAYTILLYWDAVMVDSNSNHTTVATGTLLVSPDVYQAQ